MNVVLRDIDFHFQCQTFLLVMHFAIKKYSDSGRPRQVCLDSDGRYTIVKLLLFFFQVFAVRTPATRNDHRSSGTVLGLLCPF